MSKCFDIRKGVYVIPGVGMVDTRKEVPDEKALEIYKVSRKAFPWIELKPNGIEFMKKQKFNSKQVASFVQNARSAEEVKLLLNLSDAKGLAGVADVKIKALKADVS